MELHVLCEQTHVLSLPSLQSSCQWVNIVLSANGIRNLANVVIAYPIQIDLVSQVALSHEVVVMVVI
jgi:hypothetical protein